VLIVHVFTMDFTLHEHARDGDPVGPTCPGVIIALEPHLGGFRADGASRCLDFRGTRPEAHARVLRGRLRPHPASQPHAMREGPEDRAETPLLP